MLRNSLFGDHEFIMTPIFSPKRQLWCRNREREREEGKCRVCGLGNSGKGVTEMIGHENLPG